MGVTFYFDCKSSSFYHRGVGFSRLVSIEGFLMMAQIYGKYYPTGAKEKKFFTGRRKNKHKLHYCQIAGPGSIMFSIEIKMPAIITRTFLTSGFQ